MRVSETCAFVYVAQAESFTAAAKRLRVPKSTLSKQVTRLERHLGTRLLQRTTRRLSLTETGRAYFERCRHAIEEIEDADRMVQALAGRPAGTLRVSAPFDLSHTHLARLLPEFRERYPDIRIYFMLTQRSVDLVEERFDVALRGGSLPDAEFISRKIAPSRVIFCAATSYLEQYGEPVGLDELETHSFIAMAPDARPPRWVLPTPQGPRRLPDNPTLVANEWGFLRSAILEGLGVGTMLYDYVAQDIREGRIRQVLSDIELNDGGLFAVYPSRYHLAPKVRVFVDFLVEKLERGLELVATQT